MHVADDRQAFRRRQVGQLPQPRAVGSVRIAACSGAHGGSPEWSPLGAVGRGGARGGRAAYDASRFTTRLRCARIAPINVWAPLYAVRKSLRTHAKWRVAKRLASY